MNFKNKESMLLNCKIQFGYSLLVHESSCYKLITCVKVTIYFVYAMQERTILLKYRSENIYVAPFTKLYLMFNC